MDLQRMQGVKEQAKIHLLIPSWLFFSAHFLLRFFITLIGGGLKQRSVMVMRVC